MSNPYTPGSAALPPGGAVPPDLAKKAANIQLMGILSIVFAFCCGIVSIVLGIIVLVQAGGVMTELQRYGSPPELVGKVSLGKNLAIAGLVISALMVVCGVGLNVVKLMNQ
jgi:hypothetical protein